MAGGRGLLLRFSAPEDVRSEADEYRELDREHALVLTCFGEDANSSGLELGQGNEVSGPVPRPRRKRDAGRALLGARPRARRSRPHTEGWLQVMASANNELVQSIYAPWERGDFSHSEWADHEIELVIADGPTSGSWMGLAGTVEGVREWLTAWENFRLKADDYGELDNERACSCSSVTAGTGRRAGWDSADAVQWSERVPDPRRQGDDVRPTPRRRARQPRPHVEDRGGAVVAANVELVCAVHTVWVRVFGWGAPRSSDVVMAGAARPLMALFALADTRRRTCSRVSGLSAAQGSAVAVLSMPRACCASPTRSALLDLRP